MDINVNLSLLKSLSEETGLPQSKVRFLLQSIFQSGNNPLLLLKLIQMVKLAEKLRPSEEDMFFQSIGLEDDSDSISFSTPEDLQVVVDDVNSLDISFDPMAAEEDFDIDEEDEMDEASTDFLHEEVRYSANERAMIQRRIEEIRREMDAALSERPRADLERYARLRIEFISLERILVRLS